MIKVKAVLPDGSIGFYGIKRRRDGEVFDIESEEHLGSWMEVIEEAKPKKVAKPKVVASKEGGIQSPFLMPLNNYVNFKTSIRDWTHRNDVSDDLIDDCIKLTEEYAFSMLKVREEEARATNSTGTTSRFLALPTGYRSMRKLRLIYSDHSYEVQQIAPESIDVLPATSTGRPYFYTVTSQIEFDRIADQDYTVEMQYFRDLTGISSSNTTNDILTNYPSIYHYGCLYHLFDWARDEQRALVYLQKFDQAIENANEKSWGGRWGVAPAMRIEGSTP